MVKLNNTDGNIILDGDDFSLKIDVNRIVYVKKEGSISYSAIGTVVPKGYSSKQKEQYLSKLYLMIKEEKIKKDDLE